MKDKKKFIVKVLEFIAKMILEIGIMIVLTFYMIWNLIFHNIFVLFKKLYKTKTNLLLLFFIMTLFLILMTFNAIKIKKQINELNNIKNDLESIKSEIETYKNEFEIEKNELNKEIEELNKTKVENVKPTPKPVVKKPVSIKPDIKQYIDKYCQQYNLDANVVSCIVFKESSGNPNAVNPSGKYVGLAQYSLTTFLSHRKQLGLSEEDLRTDPDASIQAMTSALARGEWSHWPNTSKMCL